MDRKEIQALGSTGATMTPEEQWNALVEASGKDSASSLLAADSTEEATVKIPEVRNLFAGEEPPAEDVISAPQSEVVAAEYTPKPGLTTADGTPITAEEKKELDNPALVDYDETTRELLPESERLDRIRGTGNWSEGFYKEPTAEVAPTEEAPAEDPLASMAGTPVEEAPTPPLEQEAWPRVEETGEGDAKLEDPLAEATTARDESDPLAGLLDEYQQYDKDVLKADEQNKKDKEEKAKRSVVELGGISLERDMDMLIPLLEKITAFEGTTEAAAKKGGYNSPYEITLSNGAFADDKSKRITTMTIQEVYDHQKLMKANPKNRFSTGRRDKNGNLIKKPSSAVGKYQFVESTLRDAVKALGLPLDTVFDKATQDKLGAWLLYSQGGLDEFVKRGARDEDIAGLRNSLSGTWASVQNSSGVGSYPGQSANQESEQLAREIQAAVSGRNITPSKGSGEYTDAQKILANPAFKFGDSAVQQANVGTTREMQEQQSTGGWWGDLGKEAMKGLKTGMWNLGLTYENAQRALTEDGSYTRYKHDEAAASIKERTNELRIRDDLQQAVNESPAAIFNPIYLSGMVAQQVPQLAAMMGVSAVTGGTVTPFLTGIKALGGVKNAALIGRGVQALSGGLAGGIMEGAGTFDQMKEMGYTDAESRSGAAIVGAVSVALNMLVMDQMLGSSTNALEKGITGAVGKGRVASAIGGFTTGGLTEAVEEMGTYGVNAGVFSAYDPEGKIYVIDGSTVASDLFQTGVVSFITGGAMNGAGNFINPKVEAPDTKAPDDSGTPVEDAQKKITNKGQGPVADFMFEDEGAQEPMLLDSSIYSSVPEKFPSIFGNENVSKDDVTDKWIGMFNRTGYASIEEYAAFAKSIPDYNAEQDPNLNMLSPEERQFFSSVTSLHYQGHVNLYEEMNNLKMKNATELDSRKESLSALTGIVEDQELLFTQEQQIKAVQESIDGLKQFEATQEVGKREQRTMDAAQKLAEKTGGDAVSLFGQLRAKDAAYAVLVEMKNRNKDLGNLFNLGDISSRIETLRESLEAAGIEPAPFGESVVSNISDADLATAAYSYGLEPSSMTAEKFTSKINSVKMAESKIVELKKSRSKIKKMLGDESVNQEQVEAALEKIGMQIAQIEQKKETLSKKPAKGQSDIAMEYGIEIVETEDVPEFSFEPVYEKTPDLVEGATDLVHQTGGYGSAKTADVIVGIDGKVVINGSEYMAYELHPDGGLTLERLDGSLEEIISPKIWNEVKTQEDIIVGDNKEAADLAEIDRKERFESIKSGSIQATEDTYGTTWYNDPNANAFSYEGETYIDSRLGNDEESVVAVKANGEVVLITDENLVESFYDRFTVEESTPMEIRVQERAQEDMDRALSMPSDTRSPENGRSVILQPELNTVLIDGVPYTDFELSSEEGVITATGPGNESQQINDPYVYREIKLQQELFEIADELTEENVNEAERKAEIREREEAELAVESPQSTPKRKGKFAKRAERVAKLSKQIAVLTKSAMIQPVLGKMRNAIVEASGKIKGMEITFADNGAAKISYNGKSYLVQPQVFAGMAGYRNKKDQSTFLVDALRAHIYNPSAGVKIGNEIYDSKGNLVGDVGQGSDINTVQDYNEAMGNYGQAREGGVAIETPIQRPDRVQPVLPAFQPGINNNPEIASQVQADKDAAALAKAEAQIPEQTPATTPKEEGTTTTETTTTETPAQSYEVSSPLDAVERQGMNKGEPTDADYGRDKYGYTGVVIDGVKYNRLPNTKTFSKTNSKANSLADKQNKKVSPKKITLEEMSSIVAEGGRDVYIPLKSEHKKNISENRVAASGTVENVGGEKPSAPTPKPATVTPAPTATTAPAPAAKPKKQSLNNVITDPNPTLDSFQFPDMKDDLDIEEQYLTDPRGFREVVIDGVTYRRRRSDPKLDADVSNKEFITPRETLLYTRVKSAQNDAAFNEAQKNKAGKSTALKQSYTVSDLEAMNGNPNYEMYVPVRVKYSDTRNESKGKGTGTNAKGSMKTDLIAEGETQKAFPTTPITNKNYDKLPADEAAFRRTADSLGWRVEEQGNMYHVTAAGRDGGQFTFNIPREAITDFDVVEDDGAPQKYLQSLALKASNGSKINSDGMEKFLYIEDEGPSTSRALTAGQKPVRGQNKVQQEGVTVESTAPPVEFSSEDVNYAKSVIQAMNGKIISDQGNTISAVIQDPRKGAVNVNIPKDMLTGFKSQYPTIKEAYQVLKDLATGDNSPTPPTKPSVTPAPPKGTTPTSPTPAPAPVTPENATANALENNSNKLDTASALAYTPPGTMTLVTSNSPTFSNDENAIMSESIETSIEHAIVEGGVEGIDIIDGKTYAIKEDGSYVELTEMDFDGITNISDRDMKSQFIEAVIEDKLFGEVVEENNNEVPNATPKEVESKEAATIVVETGTIPTPITTPVAPTIEYTVTNETDMFQETGGVGGTQAEITTPNRPNTVEYSFDSDEILQAKTIYVNGIEYNKSGNGERYKLNKSEENMKALAKISKAMPMEFTRGDIEKKVYLKADDLSIVNERKENMVRNSERTGNADVKPRARRQFLTEVIREFGTGPYDESQLQSIADKVKSDFSDVTGFDGETIPVLENFETLNGWLKKGDAVDSGKLKALAKSYDPKAEDSFDKEVARLASRWYNNQVKNSHKSPGYSLDFMDPKKFDAQARQKEAYDGAAQALFDEVTLGSSIYYTDEKNSSYQRLFQTRNNSDSMASAMALNSDAVIEQSTPMYNASGENRSDADISNGNEVDAYAASLQSAEGAFGADTNVGEDFYGDDTPSTVDEVANQPEDFADVMDEGMMIDDNSTHIANADETSISREQLMAMAEGLDFDSMPPEQAQEIRDAMAELMDATGGVKLRVTGGVISGNGSSKSIASKAFNKMTSQFGLSDKVSTNVGTGYSYTIKIDDKDITVQQNFKPNQAGAIHMNPDGTMDIFLNENLNDADAMVTFVHEFLGHFIAPTTLNSDPALNAEFETLMQNDIDAGSELAQDIASRYNTYDADGNIDVTNETFRDEYLAAMMEDTAQMFDADGNVDPEMLKQDNAVTRFYKQIKRLLYKFISRFKGINPSDADSRRDLANRILKASYSNSDNMGNSGVSPKKSGVVQFKVVNPEKAKSHIVEEARESYETFKSEDLKESRDKSTTEEVDGVIRASTGKTKNLFSKTAAFVKSNLFNAETGILTAGFDESSEIYRKNVTAINEGANRESAMKNEFSSFMRTVLSDSGVRTPETWMRSKNSVRFMKDSGYKPEVIKTEYENTKIGDNVYELTKGERVALYLHSKGEKNRAHLKSKGFSFAGDTGHPVKLTDADLDGMYDQLTPQEKKVADGVSNWLNEKQRLAIESTMLHLGQEIDIVDQYFPIRVDPKALSNNKEARALEAEEISLENMQESFAMMDSTPGAMKSRTEATSQILLEDVFTAATRSNDIVSKFYGMAVPVKSAKLFNTYSRGDLRGNQMDWLSSLLDERMERLTGKPRTDLERSVQSIAGMFTVGKLGGRAFTILKQFASIPSAVTEFDGIGASTFTNMLTNAVKGTFDTRQYMEEIMQYSPELVSRSHGMVSRDIGESFAASEARRSMSDARSAVDIAMSGLSHADRAVMSAIWEASKVEAKSNGIEEGTPEYWAYVANKAETVVRRTQPTYHQKDRSAFQSSMVLKPLTMFGSVRAKNLQMVARAIADIKNGNTAKGVKALVYVGLAQTAMVAGLDDLRDKMKGEDTEGTFLRDMGLSFSSNIPLVGEILNEAVTGFGGGGVLPVEIASDLMRSMKAVGSGDTDMADKFVALSKGATNLGIPTGWVEDMKMFYSLLSGE